jgi:hypothetical protein
MTTQSSAKAYADQFAPIFATRYIAAAKAGRSDIIPDRWRESVVAYVQGRPSRTHVNVNLELRNGLYQHKLETGKDFPLPPDFTRNNGSGESAGRAIAKGATRGAVTGLKASLPFVAPALFRAFRR